MVDAAMALFGLTIRLDTLDEYDDVRGLYDGVSNQIRTIREEIRQLGYDDASFKAYSYCLCLFMDESVMSRPWGADSQWSQTSLLSEFHQETWGGEKFFILLERMAEEAAKYQDVLEFMYFCLCLGLKGKYGVHANGDDEVQKIITRLHGIIRELRGPAPERLTDPLSNVAPRNYRIRRVWPWWTPWPIAAALIVAIYLAYSLRLDAITAQVLQSLDNILKL
jgi:type VI secretion system protein ImpK